MKFNSQTDNEFYISANISGKGGNSRQKEEESRGVQKEQKQGPYQHDFGQKAETRPEPQKTRLPETGSEKAATEKR